MYEKVRKMSPELFGSWAKESWEQITRLSSVSRQIMKATVLSEKMGTAEFKEHAWDSFKASVKEMLPEMRKARDYAQAYEREQAAARGEMLRREEETAREAGGERDEHSGQGKARGAEACRAGHDERVPENREDRAGDDQQEL